MTHEAEQLLSEALKRVKLGGGFCPIDVGAKVGLSKPQAEVAARALANAGVLVLGFDFSAHFSPAYRKAHSPVVRKPGHKVKVKSRQPSERKSSKREAALS